MDASALPRVEAPRRERIKTGPVEWDRPAATSEAKPSGERIKTGPVDWDRSAVTKSDETRETVAKPIGASLDRVLPSFATGESTAGALLRWVTGLERPLRYVGGDGAAIEAGALATLGLTRGGLHERALANLRRAIPPGFAPGDDPAVIDDHGAAILALPELVPAGEAWIAYPMPGEGLVVMREGATSTRDELARLERESKDGEARLFDKPVRVSRRGFEPLEWPSSGRSTDPGFSGGDR